MCETPFGRKYSTLVSPFDTSPGYLVQSSVVCGSSTVSDTLTRTFLKSGSVRNSSDVGDWMVD